MEKQQFSIIIILLCCVTHIQAQWEAPFSHYWEVKGYYNPSFAGETDNLRSAALYQFQQTDLKDATQRLVITADLPFEFIQKKHGAGLIAYTENIGTFRNSLLAAQYSYKQLLSGGMLNIGLQVGIYNLNYDTRSISSITDTLQNNQQQSNLKIIDKQTADLNAGISWTGNRFYAGLSIMHLNQPGFQAYNFITAYNIGLFSSLELQPMILLMQDKNQKEALASVQLEYYNKFSGGFTLISDNGYSFFAGATIQEVRFGYAYTIYNKEVDNVSKGNHELFVRYNFPLNRFKPKLQPHKSIRLL